MFTLINGFWDYYLKKEKYYVLILGLDNSGKTTFLENARAKSRNQQIKTLSPNPTVGLNVGRIENDAIILNFWDVGGQEELRPLWNKYVSDAHAIIWVVDSCDRERIVESSEVFKRIFKDKSTLDLPLLLVLNKQDLPNAVNPKDIIDLFGPSLSKRPFLPIPMSALTGIGLKESVNWIFEQIRSSKKPPCFV